MTNQAENPVTGTVAVTRQHERCRKHVKTRADQTEKHTFSRSRAAGGGGARQRGPSGRLSRKAPTKRSQNSETWGRPRAREKQRGCLSSAREEGDGTQEVLPRTTTTLVVLKTSGTTLW